MHRSQREAITGLFGAKAKASETDSKAETFTVTLGADAPTSEVARRLGLLKLTMAYITALANFATRENEAMIAPDWIKNNVPLRARVLGGGQGGGQAAAARVELANSHDMREWLRAAMAYLVGAFTAPVFCYEL